MALKNNSGQIINGISSSSTDADRLTRELINSRWGPLDGPEPVLAKILSGEAIIWSTLPPELRTDFTLGTTVHQAIKIARQEGFQDGMREQKRRTIERLGLL